MRVHAQLKLQVDVECLPISFSRTVGEPIVTKARRFESSLSKERPEPINRHWIGAIGHEE